MWSDNRAETSWQSMRGRKVDVNGELERKTGSHDYECNIKAGAWHQSQQPMLSKGSLVQTQITGEKCGLQDVWGTDPLHFFSHEKNIINLIPGLEYLSDI